MPQSLPLRMYHQTLHELCPLHWHEFYEMSFILAGEGRHVLNGRVYELTQGSIFLLTPADFHEIAPRPGTSMELFNVIFSSDMLREELYRLLFTDLKEYVTTFSGPAYTALETEFRRLWAEVHEYQVGRNLVIYGSLERILIDLARKCLAHTGSVPLQSEQGAYEKMRSGLIYIHHHFREPLSLEQVARQVHLSPNYFSECFRKAYGTAFQSYLQELRLRFAMSLLSVARLPVSDVCHASGFNTLSHFERAFKQKFGQSPREYMQRSRQDM